MRIAVDVMGGDHGCGVVAEGVRMALDSNLGVEEVHLVGIQEEIESAARQHGLADKRITIHHASEVLTMEDKPVLGLRRKKDCSILRAVNLVKDGMADAVISPGNTGGVVAASTIRLRPLAGVERPAIATIIPHEAGEFVLLDSGATVDCRPIHLLHYAIMGSVYSQQILGKPNPRVGLMSVGTEESKGNDLTFEAHKLCRKADFNFLGNVEGHDLFSGRVDVVVCDGFVGNIMLKTCESMAVGIFTWLKHELMRNPLRQLGALLARSAFRPLRERMNPDSYGGAPLLGLNGNVMIAHGSAGALAIKNAMNVAVHSVRNNINEKILHQVAAANQLVKASPEKNTPLSASA